MRARQLRIRARRPGRRVGRSVNLLAALCVSVALLAVLGFGYGPIPALGPALDPGRGAWTSAAGGEPVSSQTLTLTGLQHAVAISFTADGVPDIRAATDHDMFLALGYVHARFRLSEMDEERRLGEGRLAQLGGPTDLASDEFELRLGLLRTTQQEWAQLPKNSLAAQALTAYAQGVNDDIAQVRASGQWPAVFSLPGVYPSPWTPVDSLVIQGVLTEELDFTSTPLDYALLERSLGPARTMAWFPVIAKNAQTPYDPGPYTKLPLTPIAPNSADIAVPDNPSPASVTEPEAAAAASLLSQLSQLPAGEVHEYPDSNAWAANGPSVPGGGALLAGDPHLPQTLPSIWYEAVLSAPASTWPGSACPPCPAS